MEGNWWRPWTYDHSRWEILVFEHSGTLEYWESRMVMEGKPRKMFSESDGKDETFLVKGR
jgi:hypothetical protein